MKQGAAFSVIIKGSLPYQ